MASSTQGNPSVKQPAVRGKHENAAGPLYRGRCRPGPPFRCAAAGCRLLGISVVLVGASLSRKRDRRHGRSPEGVGRSRSCGQNRLSLMGVGQHDEQPEIDEKAARAHLRRLPDRRRIFGFACPIPRHGGAGHRRRGAIRQIRTPSFRALTPSRHAGLSSRRPPILSFRTSPASRPCPMRRPKPSLSLPVIPEHLLVLGAGPGGFVGCAGLSSPRRPGRRFLPPEERCLPTKIPRWPLSCRDACARKASTSSWGPRSSP